MAAIRCEQLTKRYPDGTVAVRQLDLEVKDGELLVLVGPSGCGKTTLLRMIAGLEEISAGTIRIGDQVVNGVHPRDRDIAMVFQSYALYPQMTVYDNIGFSLKLRGTPKREIDGAVRSTAAKLGLTELLDKRPRQLSGGQRQRVAMGRAIVRTPQVFLLDEPLSNLDAKLRNQVRGEIGELQRELGVTSVYVTHDQVEAVTLGHRVAAMRDGVIQQLGTPHALYQRPANLFVAGFIGSPAMNLIEAIVDGDDTTTWFACGSHRLACPESLSAPLRAYQGRRVALGIRPENLEDAAYASGAPPDHELRVVIDRREEISADTYLYFELDAQPVVTADIRDVSADVDASVLRDLEVRQRERRAACIARVDARSRAREGTEITLTVDIDAMRVFDLDTSQAVADASEDDQSHAAVGDRRQSARPAL